VKWAPKGERELEKPNGLCPSRVPQGGAKPPTSRNERGMIAVLGDALEGVVAVYPMRIASVKVSAPTGMKAVPLEGELVASL